MYLLFERVKLLSKDIPRGNSLDTTPSRGKVAKPIRDLRFEQVRRYLKRRGAGPSSASRGKQVLEHESHTLNRET